jgi:hypothetical protein
MEVLSAMDIQRGKKVTKTSFNSFTQPLQFLPKAEKDEDWCIHNADWIEWQGIKQIQEKARRLMKNYKLAKGIIDKTDYIPTEENEYGEIMEVLADAEETALELKFYPIIPNVINVLCNEFSKRNTNIEFRAVDDYSYNEILENKRADIEAVLLEDAQHKLLQNMLEMGLDPNSPEAQQQFNPEAIKKLPEIEEFYNKSYRTIGEKWAAKQHALDTDRFKLDELEETGFRDSLITDSEFWHFLMYEDDYGIELWNPVLTFYHKSPNVRYISQGNWVGNIDMITISDAIDTLGRFMTKEQIESLETLHPIKAARHMIDGVPNDGSLYDATLSHEDNLRDSVAMKRYMSFYENRYNPEDIVSWIVGESEDSGLLEDSQMLRKTVGYWKTQKKVGHLTSIQEDGSLITEVIDESYVIKNNPIYNTKFKSERSAETLVYGDHIDWFWINEVYGFIKIGPNRSYYPGNQHSAFDPIYLGIGQNKIGPLRFQFKGDESLYGSKLPVEGRVFSDRNTKSTSLVDLLKPSQIGFNLANNQIADILIDEIGTVIALDQNAIPQHSMGEDWGKANLAKAYVAMKDFQIMPFDTTITNTENALNFSHFQTLNLEQTNRLLGRIQIANYYKNQAMELIGLTPQRLGQQMGQIETATGIEQSVSGSYTQTEHYFIQHSDQLMPRVHQMRTDLAQYYHSSKSSIRLQSSLTSDERAFMEINGIDLMLIDINVFCKVNANTRKMLEDLKKYAFSNNTTGATIYDLGNIYQAQTVGALEAVMKKLETRAEQQRAEQMKAEQEKYQAELAAKEKERQMELDHEARENEKNRRKDILVAEIKSAGYGAMQDLNANQQSDYMDALKEVRESEQYQDTMNFNREKESNKKSLAERKLDIEQQKVNNDLMSKQTELQIAKTNKNKYDKK